MPTHEAVIVGAGFGGMGAAIELKRQGLEDLVILEREDDLGGTWHVNHYPGLAVDIASVTYQYSFEPNPYWSRLFAPGAELKAYADHVANKYDLRGHMRFGVTVDGAQWDEDERHWVVRLAGGEQLTARYLITATGFLSQPKVPDIPGVGDFAGKVVHTARWDDDFDLTGRRAAIIGTGATAVQLVPEVARKAAELTVFQRTPIWVTPKIDGEIPRWLQRLFALVPPVQRAARLVSSTLLEALVVFGVLHYTRLSFFNRRAEAAAKQHLRRQVRDPETRRKLTPDYSFGCKRPTFSNDYLRTFNKPNVHLQTEPIERIEPDGIVTADGARTEIDTLLLATGYDLWEVNFPAIEIIGRQGRNLGKWWRDNRFQAYQGVSVPQFPNLLVLNAPYAYNGLSYFWTIEGQMSHIARLFGGLRKRGADTFEVRQEANDAYLERMNHRLRHSVFYNGDCANARSYYFNQHGEAALLRPMSVLGGQREHRRFSLDDYAYA